MNDAGPILLIEDDDELAEVVTMNIGDLGLAVARAKNGREGLRQALTDSHALIILDILLPGLDGLSVCRQIREKNPLVPILMLTAKSAELDRVQGLEIGADDYLTKPFSMRELLARVKALLRRVRAEAERNGIPPDGDKSVVRFGVFSVDFDQRKVLMNGQTIDLTVKEFELLALFIRHPGRTYSRSDLLKLVWGDQYEGYEHTVNSHINRLRIKIEKDPGDPAYLKTVWGVGYRFVEQEEVIP
jgi:DNA-binding response OmpR family regulator